MEVVGRKNRLLNKADEFKTQDSSQVAMLHKSKSGRSEWLSSKNKCIKVRARSRYSDMHLVFISEHVLMPAPIVKALTPSSADKDMKKCMTLVSGSG